MNVRTERTGWRCQEISKRHREWGYNCPAVDLDFMVAEYNHGEPVALVEYKEKHARTPDLNHATYRALRALADGYKTGLPFLIAFYCPVDWWFIVIPVNKHAKRIYDSPHFFTEQEFVKSLYYMRKHVLSNGDFEAIKLLNTIEPPRQMSMLAFA